MAKILLVEDDKSLREIYGVRLMAEGYEIVSAGDGEEALAMAIKERPDLIVSDVMMPKISGFDMLDILRSTTETKNVKVIMMTALSSDDQRARGEALGADRYLVKSQVGIEDVVRTVHDVLGDGISTPAPAPTPVVNTAPSPVNNPATPPIDTPVIDNAAVAPVVEPDTVTAPPAPLEAPVFPEPIAEPTPPAPNLAPPAQEQMYAPATETPIATTAPAPIPAPAPAPIPAPAAAPATMPQPTAPFSTPAPASIGERVIAPLNDAASAQAPGVLDISSQIEQALSNPATSPPTPGTPPTL